MRSNDSHPTIAITMGDPAGIGPEIIARYFADRELEPAVDALVVGRAAIMQRACDLVGCGKAVVRVSSIADVSFNDYEIPVLECGNRSAENVQPGEVSAAGGQLAHDALQLSTQLAREGQVEAIVTAPLNKGSLRLAGIDVPGHTELLARFCGVEKVAMMLHLPPGGAALGELGLSVAHVSLHTALRNVFQEVTTASIVDKCQLTYRFCQSLLNAAGLNREPRIGVAALNPHGGENGLFGDEEMKIIQPAVHACRSRGLNVIGPEPCDTLIRRAALGEFDAVVAMYHDQGHIALKMLDMFSTVNVTLGLPIIRTSVAHGTADSIAWTGQASEQSLRQAMRVARQLVVDRNRRFADESSLDAIDSSDQVAGDAAGSITSSP